MKGNQEDIIRGLKVLLVEDDPINQKLAELVFKKMGVDIVLASDGREALDQMERRSFDIVFMDVNMPYIDGITATRMVREGTSVNRDVPIVAITASNTHELEKCYRAGMVGSISKPIRPIEVEEILDRYLRVAS